MITRRHVVLGGAAIGAAALVPLLRSRTAGTAAPVPGGTLDPTTIPKYVTPLFVLPAMPPASAPTTGGLDLYSIGARQFAQQILPAGLPISQVFGFGSTTDPTSFHAPAYTIEAKVGRETRVTWTNQLMTTAGDFRPHLLTLDPTLHWANPPGGTAGRDSRPDFGSTPPPYRGPVPLVVHLHGAHTFEEADGYPEAWYLPNARNIPSGYARVGSFYDQYKAEAQARSGVTWGTGNAVFQYRNDQRATTLWYHSHELGLTRANVYAGLSGLYLLRGGSADLKGPTSPSAAVRPARTSNRPMCVRPARS